VGKRGSVSICGEVWPESIQRVIGGVSSDIIKLNMNNHKKGGGFGLI
jgi:hypothetical protein